MTYYNRHLPHWQPADAQLFVTWRLFGSVPKQLAVAKPEAEEQPWVTADRQLALSTGPFYLRDVEVAAMTADALVFGEQDLKLYDLLAWVIMPNHVHILIQPKVALAKITKSIKQFTARRANQMLKRTGPFWQKSLTTIGFGTIRS